METGFPRCHSAKHPYRWTGDDRWFRENMIATMSGMEDLYRRFRDGDPEAVRVVYRRHVGAVHTVARSIVGDPELAAEVVQTTFVKAWRAASTFQGDRELAPWLYAIARRSAIDALRHERRPTRGDHAPQFEVGVESISFERTWEIHEVRRAIDDLGDHEREIVRRAHLLGQTHQQISDELGLPLGTVKSRSSRAHRRLAAALAHLAPDPVRDDDAGTGPENHLPAADVLRYEEHR
jgi:RNA polymerase sigma-70 factor, ECF subfamily